MYILITKLGAITISYEGQNTELINKLTDFVIKEKIDSWNELSPAE